MKAFKFADVLSKMMKCRRNSKNKNGVIKSKYKNLFKYVTAMPLLIRLMDTLTYAHYSNICIKML